MTRRAAARPDPAAPPEDPAFADVGGFRALFRCPLSHPLLALALAVSQGWNGALERLIWVFLPLFCVGLLAIWSAVHREHLGLSRD